MDEVRICPMDTDGRYHAPDVKDCPNCAVEMETYHRRRTDEGMELDASSMRRDAITVAVTVVVVVIIALLLTT